MTTQGTPQILPAILGTLRQSKAEGELTLEQNDGTRRFYWRHGDIVHLQSDVAGEQFGNYLLRQGILDYNTLNQVLESEENFRLGDKVVQWGLMTLKEREYHLLALQEQIMVHAMEHAIIHASWKPGAIGHQLSADLHFQFDHRIFVWNSLAMVNHFQDICDLLYEEKDWRWTAPSNLLAMVEDLPLDPKTAFAVTLLGADPVGYQTLMSITGLEEEEAARLIVVLWTLGALSLLPDPGKSKDPLADLLAVPAKTKRPIIPRRPDSPTPTSIPEPIPLAEEPPFSRPRTSTPPPSMATPSTPLPPMATPSKPLPPVPPIAPPPPMQVTPPAPPPRFRPLPAPEAMPMPVDPVQMSILPMDSVDETPMDAVRRKEQASRLFSRAKALLLQERTAEAVRALEESTKLNPASESSFEAWLLLGKLRVSNPAWASRALEALQAASRLKPKMAEPWALMGELYHRKGYKANAVACYKRALEIDPSVPIPVDMTYFHPEEPTPQASGGGLMGLLRSIMQRRDGEV